MGLNQIGISSKFMMQHRKTFFLLCYLHRKKKTAKIKEAKKRKNSGEKLSLLFTIDVAIDSTTVMLHQLHDHV
jgi:hypothetical protein